MPQWTPRDAQPRANPPPANAPADKAVARKMAVDKADPEIVREMALRRLDRRAYGQAELKAVLIRQGTDEAVTTKVLDRLTQVGLLDDVAYADALVEHRSGQRHVSRRAVTLDLRRRGLTGEVIAAATSDLDAETELAGARAVASARLPRLTGLDRPVAWRRLAGALARKGYGPDVVTAVTNEMLRE